MVTAKRIYVLHPGFVRSRSDGQEHYISAAQLASLYGVKARDCLIYPADEIAQRLWRDLPGALHLSPRGDGDYSLSTGDRK